MSETAGIRFTPPPVRLAPALEWVLLRAFAPAACAAPAPSMPGEAVDTARRLGLDARIGFRVPAAVLTDELGDAAATELRRASQVAAGVAMTADALLEDVVGAAGTLGIRLMVLKGSSLRMLGIAPAGARPQSDVDVLADEPRARALAAALRQVGFEQVAKRDPEHHLAPLSTPLGTLEIHTSLRGVRVPGRDGWMRLADAEDAGLARAARPSRPGVLVPEPALLAAHLLHHGLVHHGLDPVVYPLTRMLADLADLSFGDDEALRRQALSLVAGEVREDEAEAVGALCRRLAAGEVERAWREKGPGTLLQHVAASLADDDYVRAMRLEEYVGRNSESGAAAALAGRVWNSLVLTRGQVDELYGRPATAAGYWARRVQRLVALPVDAARMAAARVRLARARRRARP